MIYLPPNIYMSKIRRCPDSAIIKIKACLENENLSFIKTENSAHRQAELLQNYLLEKINLYFPEQSPPPARSIQTQQQSWKSNPLNNQNQHQNLRMNQHKNSLQNQDHHQPDIQYQMNYRQEQLTLQNWKAQTLQRNTLNQQGTQWRPPMMF